jgi:hypothetical protein
MASNIADFRITPGPRSVAISGPKLFRNPASIAVQREMSENWNR